MNKPIKTRFPLKIIVSYLVLAALAVIVSVFLFSELRLYLDAANNNDGKKVVETGSLINLVYETDSFSRLALLSEDEKDFERFQTQVDSLYQSIADFRKSTQDEDQKLQLDSIKRLLISKNKNITPAHFLMINFLRILLCVMFLLPIILRYDKSDNIYIYNFFIIYFVYLFSDLIFKVKTPNKINL